MVNEIHANYRVNQRPTVIFSIAKMGAMDSGNAVSGTCKYVKESTPTWGQ